MSRKKIISVTKLLLPMAIICLFFVTDNEYVNAGENISISGNTQLRYIGRFQSDSEQAEDHKLHQIGDIEVSEKYWGHFRLIVAGDMMEDLNDTTDDNSDLSKSIHDSWDESYHGYLYQCRAEIYRLGFLNYARLGRQYINNELHSHLDGINISLNILNNHLQPFAYGGIPVRLYDNEGYNLDDYLNAQEAGGGTHIIIGQSTKITLEYKYIEEKIEENSDSIGSYGESGTSRFHQSAFSIKQDLMGYGLAYISFVALDKIAKHINTVFSFSFDNIGLDVDASYFYQFKSLSEFPATESPYINLTGEIKPYHLATLDISKDIYYNLISISFGSEVRLMGSDEDETEFNHSYFNGYLALSFDNLFLNGLHFSLQCDHWQVLDTNSDDELLENNENDTIISGGGEVGYRKPKFINLSLGFYYSLYKSDYNEDFYSIDEKSHVYTFYSKIRYYIKPWLYVDARYELETYDMWDHRVIATVGQEF